MNKIYKVIWSKVRNCYVAVSEIAKRNGKSCTSVNCGAKANRGHAGVALAIALSLSMTGGGVAWGEEITVKNPQAITADKSSTDYILSYGTVSTAAGAGTTFTVTGTGKVKSIKSEKSGNVITIQANGEVTGSTGDGGLAFSIKGGVNNNSVTVAGSTEYYVAGGASDSSNVTKNTVTVTGTTRDVYGGITGSGSSDSSGSATYNTVNINTGGSVSSVYGGSTQGRVGNAEHNTVTIKGTASYVYGGQSFYGSATYNSVIVDNGTVNYGIYGGEVNNFVETGTTSVSNNTVTIKGSQSQISRPGYNYSSSNVYGGIDYRRTGYSTVNNNGVEISGGEFNTYTDIYGAKSVNGSPSNNYVTITGGQVPGSVYGGYSENGSATGNRVSIDTTNGATVGNRVSAAIYGGFVKDGTGNANSNEITLKGHGTYSYIYGGFVEDGTGKAINNKIYMNGYSGSNLKGGRTPAGGGDAVTGNQLILQTAGNSAESTQNFETVKITNGVKWLEDGDTVFDAGRLYSKPKLDISEATLIKNASSYGTMTLLNDDYNGSVLSSGVIIKYDTGSTDEVTLGGSSSTDYVIKSGSNGGSSSSSGVSFTYSKKKEHTISLINYYYSPSSSSDYKKVVYSVADKVAGISFGTMKWGTGRNATSTTTTNYDFAGVTSVNASGLTFNFANESDKAKLSKTSGSQLTTNMTLLSNANRLAAGKTVTYKNNGAYHTQTIPYSVSNGASLSGTLTGTVSTSAGTYSPNTGSVQYTITGMTLDNVDLANWNGTSSDAVPTGWTRNSNGVTVSATGFTVPTDITPGNTRNILTTNTNYYFSDNNISGDYKYKAYDLNNDSSNNVTFLGTQSKGVKAGGTNSRNLVYAVDMKYVNSISLNSGMTWGDSIGRAADNTYRFNNLSSITVSDSLFSNPGAVSGSKYLVTGATSLTANKVAEIAHAQDFTKPMSNNTVLGATLAGTISTAEATKVKYTATGITVNTVDLKNWDKTNAANTPDNWTAKEGGVDVVNTGDAITGLAAGVTKVIMTAPTENYFGTVSSSEAYNNTIFSNDEGDTGVTLSGNHYKGVNVEDTGRTLKYYAETMDTTDITLGSMTWDAGRTAGDLYIFNNVNSITATGLSFGFTNDAQKATLSASSSMTLLSSATGLAANKTVTDANYSQDVSYNAANGTVLTGTLTGTVVTEAGAIKYNASSMTLDTVNLAGWDVSTPSVVPAGWSLKKDGSNAVEATVQTDNMKTTLLSNLAYGTIIPILTATGTAYFDGIKINGANAWNGAVDIVDADTSGVSIVGTSTGTGVKVDSGNKNQIIYQKTKEAITNLRLAGITFEAGTKARTFGNTYDLTAAPIVADNNLFTTESQSLVETGDTMTLVDATGAIKNTSNETLTTFNGGASKKYVVNFKDTIKSNSIIKSDSIKFTGTHTDTLSQEDDTATSTKKSLLKYEVGAKKVTTATLSGAIDWRDGGTYYTNGVDVNENGKDATYTFDGDTAVDIAGVQFSTTEDPIAGGKTKSMTLLKDVNGVAETNISGTPAFAVAFTQNNSKLDAKATGSASVSGNDVVYSVSSVAIDKINVTSIENDADTVPTGWTLAKDNSDKVIAKVETDGLVVASPSGLEPGETKVIIEAATGSTGFFKDVAVNGSHAWKVDGSTITSDLDIGGVAITGTQTKGGVKVNEANTNQIIYEESKKKINTLTLGSVTFANDDGTAATVARTFDKTYDVSTATISTDDLAFANSDIMETGNSMRIVDASAAIPNAISNKKLPAFTEQTKKVAFTDTITGKNLTLKGAHTDTLSQDAAQTTLTYTVGDKVVSSATLTGDITWSDGDIHYTNGSDANQNGTKATYTFNSDSDVDISGVTFSATSDPLTGSTKSMTLLKDVNGVAVNKVSGVPAFAVTIDQTNTKLDAKATGASGVSGNDVTFTVSGVTLDKITVKSANGTADKVPANWTMAAGATIETDSMTVPELAAGTHVDILQSDTDGFFAKVVINGANAYGNTQDAFTESDAAKSVTIAGTQDKGVTLNTEKKHLIYKAGTLDVASVTLGLAEWKKGATVFDRSGAGYNYAGVAALGTDGFAVSYASPETVATGDSMTLLKANKTLSDMAEQVRKTSYSYTPVTGVTIDANITGKLATSGGAVTYTATENQASKLTFTNVDWKDSGALLTRPSNITFAGADVDTAKIHFQNVKELDANRKMTLVSDFGDSVGTITGSKYTVGAGLEGEGAASLSGSDLVFTTKTGARDLAAQEQTHNTLMVMEAGMAVLAAGREHLGQAMVGLADPQNAGSDGTRIGASMGGGWSRYKTGSHVDSNNWNVAAAVGSKRELKRGSLEWGVFGEYGKSNYTLHSDAGRGDGDSHYAGGGLMAKWTNKHDVYTEASVRLGRLNDTASNLLRDAAGNGYGYDVHANYFGAHVGIGKIIHYKGGKSLDVYGKYFYTKRDGVDFASGGNNYSLDSVASSILRVGARYGTTDKKWNWYGGLAYEYEFDGKSEGTVDGIGIRAASVKGGSVRGEIGLRMSATKTNPWQTDISIYGYGGKHRGFGGSVNVAYMF